MMKKLKLTFHTVKHLSLEQILSQIKWRLFREIPPCTSEETLTPNFSCKTNFIQPTPKLSNITSGHFNFINKTKSIGFPPIWDAGENKLWNYNLHYLDYIHDLCIDDAKKLILDWINKNEISLKSNAWEPYPISLRLINLIIYFYHTQKESLSKDKDFESLLLESIKQQANALLHQIEYHIGGNHLLENTVALLFIGLAFKSPIAHKCFLKGSYLIKRELPKQFLKDGMHYEITPGYHERMVWLLLSLYNIQNSEINKYIKPYLENSLSAFHNLIQPDGEISQFNDSSLNLYTPPKNIFNFANQLQLNFKTNLGTFELRESGYYGYLDHDNYLIAKFGPAGPNQQPGHAHSDIFSFELSYLKERIVVDSGVFDYTNSELRKYCRSTQAHNTVCINNTDQIEIWSIFRVARRVKPEIIKTEISKDKLYLEAIVPNYKLKGKTQHHRILSWEDNSLVIQDEILGKHQPSISYLHLHPDCVILNNNQHEIIIKKHNVTLKIESKHIPPTIQKGWYCPEFNIKKKQIVLSWLLRKNTINQYKISIAK